MLAEMRRGGRESLESLWPGWSPERLIKTDKEAAPGMQFVIDQISEEIERSIVKSGLQLNLEFFAGEFPTGSFNAQACVVEDGTLLLVNTGLMVFLHKASKLITHSIEFSDFGDDGKPIFGTTEPTEPGAMTHSEQIEAFAELLLGYLSMREDWIPRVRRIPLATGAKAMLSAMVVHSCEKFVLAHEYGHAIAGHLTAPRTMVSKTPVGDVEFVCKSWSEEFEADLIAAMLLVIETPRQIKTYQDLFTLQFATVGPFFFFALDELITRVALEIKGLAGTSIITDHPPSRQRMQAVREFYQRLGGPAMTEMGDAYAEFVGHLGDDVMEMIAHLLRREQC